MKLHSKAEYNQKVADEKEQKQAAAAETKQQNNNEAVDAALIIKALGGSDNIEKVDSCFTRLRLVVKNSDIIDENTLKNETGAMGVFKKGTTVQVVYGMKINAVRAAVDQELGIGE